MNKTAFNKGQRVEFRITTGGMWLTGATYVGLVPGPEADGPDARVRVRDKAGSMLKVRLGDVRKATPYNLQAVAEVMLDATMTHQNFVLDEEAAVWCEEKVAEFTVQADNGQRYKVTVQGIAMPAATVTHSNSWYRVTTSKHPGEAGPFRFAAAVTYLNTSASMSLDDARKLVLRAIDNGTATTETE